MKAAQFNKMSQRARERCLSGHTVSRVMASLKLDPETVYVSKMVMMTPSGGRLDLDMELSPTQMAKIINNGNSGRDDS